MSALRRTWPLWLGSMLCVTAAQADLSGVPPVSATPVPAPPAVATPVPGASAPPPVAAASAPETSDEAPAPRPRGYELRLRLDDGRYRGFHQDNPDELRTGDRVGAESDQIRDEHRARGRDLYP
jgi:hypothetical protein